MSHLLEWIESFLSERRQRVVLGDNVSEWTPVLSGVPQGSVLGPLLFIIYINDLPENIKYNCCKLYADDSKIIAELKDERDTLNLQSDLDGLIRWTDTWLMRLNYEKCKVMHIGQKNKRNTYVMQDKLINSYHLLTESNLEKDLGIHISSDLKWHHQARSAAMKASSILGLLKSTFKSRKLHIWKNLYRTYVRPHLEFAIPVWNPFHKEDQRLLENVQRRATKIPHEMKGLEYEERCKRFGLTSLQSRRIRGDCIQKFKEEKRIDLINWKNEPPLIEPIYSLPKRYHREIVRNCEIRYHFFNNRICSLWNELTKLGITNSLDTNRFKEGFDRSVEDQKNLFGKMFESYNRAAL